MSNVALEKASLPAAGDVIAGKYAVLRQIGEGGMGVVFEAMHVRLRQRLAIKVLRPNASNHEQLLARFEREALITAQLRSVHSARIIDVDRLPGGLPYIVLEYLEGRDLEAELLAEGPLPVAEAVDVALQVAAAMGEAHALGIVHRDLKPSNLFVCRAGPRRVVKVLDFGISRSGGAASTITDSSTYVGTPLYAAPEQLRDSANADARSDVWSLGIVLFELLTGRTPFNGSNAEVIARVMVDPVPSPRELRSDLPAELARIVLLALRRDPAQRYGSMKELARDLAPYASAEAPSDTGAAQPVRARLGEILVGDGLLSERDLERAIAEQRRSGELLGRVLLDLGLVGRADLVAALAKQQGLGGSGASVEDAWFARYSARKPTPAERERAEREAQTLGGVPPASPARRRWPSAWVAIVACLWIGSIVAAVAAR